MDRHKAKMFLSLFFAQHSDSPFAVSYTALTDERKITVINYTRLAIMNEIISSQPNSKNYSSRGRSWYGLAPLLSIFTKIVVRAAWFPMSHRQTKSNYY